MFSGYLDYIRKIIFIRLYISSILIFFRLVKSSIPVGDLSFDENIECLVNKKRIKNAKEELELILKNQIT
jgi:hypothetical protein